MTPPTSHNETWKYTVLFTLTKSSQGSAIQGNLVFDAKGNLYGASELGGDLACAQEGCGTVFELKRPTKDGGKWRFSVLHTFTGTPDGAEPFAGVAFDQKGNLYGTTDGGGTFGYGAGGWPRLSRPFYPRGCPVQAPLGRGLSLGESQFGKTDPQPRHFPLELSPSLAIT
jgi:hypothetical protein